jgi:hypothetical protein
MAYIINNAKWVSDKKVKQASILVKQDRIQSIRKSFDHYRYMKMDVSPFIMTPVHVMCDNALPETVNHKMMKDYFIEHFISKGCTTLLTSFKINFFHHFQERLRQKKKTLLNSPIDYLLGVAAPASLITSELVRLCKRHKIPIIWIDLSSRDRFLNIKWGWIKDVLFHYPITFAPFFSSEIDNNSKEKELKIWQKTMKSENIPHFSKEISQKTPLSLGELKKLGIYPKRGNFLVGGEVSYNLYEIPEVISVDDNWSIDYDSHCPRLTINKGKLYKVNNQTFYYPGEGKELIINTPRFFI